MNITFATYPERQAWFRMAYQAAFEVYSEYWWNGMKNNPIPDCSHFYSPVSMTGGLDHKPEWFYEMAECEVDESIHPDRFRYFKPKESITEGP